MRLIFLLTAIVCNGSSFAQHYNIRLFTTADGLPASGIHSISFDSRGYMWLGFYTGICRYDGQSFIDYSLQEALPTIVGGSVYEDRQHRMWVVSQNKIYRFEHNRYYEIPINTSRLISWIYFVVELTDGKIIFSCEGGGTFVFTGKNFEPCSLFGFPPETVFRSIINIPGGLLVNTVTTIYEKQGNKPWKVLFKADGLNWISSTRYYSGKKYFNDWEGAIYELSNTQPPLLVFKPPEEKKGTNVFFIDSRNNLWVTSFDNYLYVVNRNGEPSDFFSKHKMRRYSISGLSEDKWGNIWAGGFEGLMRFSPSFVDTIAGIEFSYFFRNIYKGKSCLYFFGGSKGVYRFIKGQEIKFPREVEQKVSRHLKGINIASATEDSTGALWICTTAGKVFVLSNNAFKQLSVPVRILSIEATRDKLFLASDHVLYRWINNQCQAIDSIVEGTPFSRITTMMADSKNRLWIGDNERLILLTNDGLLNISDRMKLSSYKFWQYKVFNKELWMITGENGIVRIKETGNGQFYIPGMLNITNGMANDIIMSFCFDKKNYLWYYTVRGIYRSKINLSNDSIYLSYTRKFGENEGLHNTIWDSGPMAADEAGNIWVAGLDKIYKIDARNIPADTIAPTVQIERTELMRKGADWNHFTERFSSYHNLPSNPRLPHQQNSLSFYLNGVTMNNASAVKFKYKLNGYDEDWSNITSNRIVTYTNLPSGNYRFEARAMNEDGIWSKTPDSFEFIIVPPFWQTWWFRGVVALLIIAGLYYFIRRREKIKLEKNQIALQIAELRLQTLQSQMNPHFIFNSLNSVQKFILEHNPAEGAKYLSKFSKLIRKILDNSRHNLLSLQQIVETLEMYIELEALRFNREFSYELQKNEDDEIMNRKLPPMLLQPFVENAIWHGLMPKEGEKKLFVSIQKKNASLYCMIEDNGVGRKKAPVSEGHVSRGEKMILGMAESLQQLLHVKAEIIITDLNDASETTGTRVEIYIPEST